ncbi:hypothetical protein KFE25_007345 [Diacronema lutheri]|uniref:Uncharacterized protein n=1 Tax=Diacronema lutheri TaxID=2081491 RepID=A0A8J5XUW0_DIALT|nr:hypothetical protein KFE25_007345 [Diacronema lutheri]
MARNRGRSAGDVVVSQIGAVMAEAEKEVRVVVLKVDGTTAEATVDHRKVGEMIGGTPTVVGAIRALGVQAVAMSAAQSRPGAKKNAHKLPEASFEPGIKGDIVLLRTADDEVGSPLDLGLKDYSAWVDEGMPEAEEGEDDDEGEEDEGEEESEGESEGEDDDDDDEDDDEAGDDDEEEEEEEAEEEGKTDAAAKRSVPDPAPAGKRQRKAGSN